MIWNDEMVFIHAPRTGGTSVARTLHRRLRGVVYSTVPRPHESSRQRLKRRAYASTGRGPRRLILLGPGRHETMAEAAALLSSHGRRLETMPEVFATIRNPYDFEISRFHYLQRPGLPDDGGPARELALAGDFAEFLRRSPLFGHHPPRLDLFYRMDHRSPIPDNLTLLRFESLADDFERAIGPHLTAGPALDHTNRSERPPGFADLSDEIEQLIHDRHRWLFDQGFYERGNRR